MKFALKEKNGFKLAGNPTVRAHVEDLKEGQHPIASIVRWPDELLMQHGVYAVTERRDPLLPLQRHDSGQLVDEGGKPVLIVRARDLPLSAAKDQARGMIKAKADAALREMVAEYSPEERETWGLQVEEARAFLGEPRGEAPFLTRRAKDRGQPVERLAETVLRKHAAYRDGSASVLGAHDAARMLIDSAETVEAVRKALGHDGAN